MGDIVFSALNEIRYLEDSQTGKNVSRMTLHPVWTEALRHVKHCNDIDRTGLVRGQIKQVEAQQAINTAKRQIAGLAVGMAAALGWNEHQAREELPAMIKNMLALDFCDRDRPLSNRLSAALKKRRFRCLT